MADRLDELSKLQSFIGKVDTELTMILQHLQWDKNKLLKGNPLVSCKYNENHMVTESTKPLHEQKCFLSKHGYSEEDVMLPDALYTNTNTLIKFNKSKIEQIINNAAYTDPSFKRGVSSTQGTEVELEPLTLDRLQVTYTPDERRALHDAVVASSPACHDLSDLALLSSAGEASTSTAPKSRLEVLSELRDMKRRRTKYRVAARGANYSHTLRDVIKTQMEMYAGVKVKEEPLSPEEVLSKRPENYSKTSDSSMIPRNTSHGRADKYENNVSNSNKHKEREHRDKYSDHPSSSHKRQTNHLIQYPDPKKYREVRNKHDSAPKSSRSYRNEGDFEVKREKHSERDYRDKSCDNSSSRTKTRFIEVKQEIDSECEEYGDHHKETKEYSSRDKNRHYEETDNYNRREKDDKRRNEYKRDGRHRDWYKDSRKHEKSSKDKYRKEKYAGRDSKYDKYYYDSQHSVTIKQERMD